MAVFLLLTLLAGALASPSTLSLNSTQVDPEGFVINGEQAGRGDWPWQLALEFKRSTTGEWAHTCGATLLSRRWAMTAAHCVHERPEPLRLMLGQSLNGEVSDADQVIAVQKVIKHEKYLVGDAAFANDIALLYLAEAATYNTLVQPARLARPRDTEAFERGTCWVTGFGKDTYSWEIVLPGFLNEAEVSVLSTAECKSLMALGISNDIWDNHLCVFDKRDLGSFEKSGVCSGDSGGPVSCQLDGHWYVLGAASFVVRGFFTPCSTGVPGVYTRVTAYRGWIEQHSGLQL